MRIIIQKVINSNVKVNNIEIAKISKGFNLLLSIHKEDKREFIHKAISKILKLRLFEDDKGINNRSIIDIEGEILIISQFTLYADIYKGSRPSFSNCMNPQDAEIYYNKFVEEFRNIYPTKVFCGEFGAKMEVNIKNDGPFTIILDIDN